MDVKSQNSKTSIYYHAIYHKWSIKSIATCNLPSLYSLHLSYTLVVPAVKQSSRVIILLNKQHKKVII